MPSSFTDPPKFLKQPSGDTKSEGQSVSLECQIEGKPKPTVTWLKDGVEVNSTGDSRITASNNLNTWTLAITQLNRNDEGSYTCQANNSLQTITSATANLTVICKSLLLVICKHKLSCKHTQRIKLNKHRLFLKRDINNSIFLSKKMLQRTVATSNTRNNVMMNRNVEVNLIEHDENKSTYIENDRRKK